MSDRLDRISVLVAMLPPREQERLELSLLGSVLARMSAKRRDACLAFLREQATLSREDPT